MKLLRRRVPNMADASDVAAADLMWLLRQLWRRLMWQAANTMWLLGWLWQRVMWQAANEMRLLGRLMGWLMRAADEGG